MTKVHQINYFDIIAQLGIVEVYKENLELICNPSDSHFQMEN